MKRMATLNEHLTLGYRVRAHLKRNQYRYYGLALFVLYGIAGALDVSGM
jgi:hypothetical protein